jgi:hypothetical protein
MDEISFGSPTIKPEAPIVKKGAVKGHEENTSLKFICQNI